MEGSVIAADLLAYCRQACSVLKFTSVLVKAGFLWKSCVARAVNGAVDSSNESWLPLCGFGSFADGGAE